MGKEKGAFFMKKEVEVLEEAIAFIKEKLELFRLKEINNIDNTPIEYEDVRVQDFIIWFFEEGL